MKLIDNYFSTLDPVHALVKGDQMQKKKKIKKYALTSITSFLDISTTYYTAMSDNTETLNEVDPSSFASILAGINRMREAASGVSSSTTDVISNQETNLEKPPSTATRVSEQQQEPVVPTKDIVNRASPYQRSSLNKATAKPVTPLESQRSSTPRSKTHGPSQILINPHQKNNPILTKSRLSKVPWRYDSNVLSDYYISPTFQILFLSLKYHNLHPEYLEHKWRKFNKGSIINDPNSNDKALRVLLVHVDITNPQDTLRRILSFCNKVRLTLVLAWSQEEAGNYIATAKSIDDAPTKAKKSIEGNKATDYNTCVSEALTGIKLVNKSDVANLLGNCKSIKQVVLESCREDNGDGFGLANIHGLGATKLRNLKQTFLEPFITNKDYNQ